MKRKILVTILALVVVFGSLGLFACEENNDSQLAKYFVFDNVTITAITKQRPVEGVNEVEAIDSESILKVNGEKWSLLDKNAYRQYNGNQEVTVVSDILIYFDGESAYYTCAGRGMENIKDERYNDYDDVFFCYLNQVMEFENKIIQSDEGVYTAEEIDYYGVWKFTDVTVTIADEKLSSMHFTFVDSTMLVEYQLTFTEWGQTVVA